METIREIRVIRSPQKIDYVISMLGTSDALEHARRLHQAGKLAEAERGCRQILEDD